MECDEFHEKVEGSASDSGGSMFQSSPAIPKSFIRNLSLSKETAETLAFRLKDKNCLGALTKFYREREKILPQFFQQEELVYCKDMRGFLLKMGVPQFRGEVLRLCIDSSKRSLKCALLHNGNMYASLLIGYSTKLREEYNKN